MILKSIKETKKFAGEFVESLEAGQNVILLKGNLGAGKTTFSQAVLEYVGAEKPFTSPTFVIMKEYSVDFKNQNNLTIKKVYHLDCYRIDDKSLLDLGWEDIILNRENLILLEWPEKIEKVLPKNFVQIKFEVLNEDERGIKVG